MLATNDSIRKSFFFSFFFFETFNVLCVRGKNATSDGQMSFVPVNVEGHS